MFLFQYERRKPLRALSAVLTNRLEDASPPHTFQVAARLPGMDLDARDHGPPLRRAIDLAVEAGERGDGPFGSVLVRGGEIRMEASNRTRTENDLALHPELTLARRAAGEWSPVDRAETVMYTSTEPCAMCATGMAYAGLGAVVYSVAGERLADLRGSSGGIPCDEVFERLGADVAVEGPVLEDEGLAVHRRFLD
jgi:tRNA(Arg) A34 adenosine deaminase TadA